MALEIKGKTYKVRELTFADSMALSIILDKTNFNLTDFNKDIKDVKGKRLTKEQLQQISLSFAAEMVGHIVRNYHKAYKESRDLLASLIGVEPKELESMPLTTPILIIKELAKTVNLTDFFEQVAG